MMALKPTAEPKLMQVMTKVAAITVQRAVWGTSASRTCECINQGEESDERLMQMSVRV